MSFQAVQSKIAKSEGISKDRAGAILASSTRNASPAAKRKNPNLKKVLMPKDPEAKAKAGVSAFYKKHGMSCC